MHCTYIHWHPTYVQFQMTQITTITKFRHRTKTTCIMVKGHVTAHKILRGSFGSQPHDIWST